MVADKPHETDADCADHLDPDTSCCMVCGVEHGDACPVCGGRAYHNSGCTAGSEGRSIAQ